MPDDDERPAEASSGQGGGAGGRADHAGDAFLDVVIPDDISALEADIRAYRKELRARRRAARRDRLFTSPGWRRFGLPAVFVGACLLLAATTIASIVVTGSRHGSDRPAKQPIAARATVADGRVGGLLPDAVVVAGPTDVHLRALRPAMIALVPPHCGCAQLLDTLAGQAEEYHLDLLLVGSDSSDQLASLAAGVRRGHAVALRDDGSLAQTYAAQGVTVLLLAADGRVTSVQRAVVPAVRLEPQLSAMVAGTSASAQRS